MQLEKFKKVFKNKRVLYVEDEIVIQEEIASILQNFFDTVLVAKDGKEALEIYKNTKTDILITDLRMPIMDGIELIKEIKKINPNQQVIVTSAHSEAEYFVELIELGVNSFLIKPVSIEHLLNTMYNLFKAIDTEKKLEAVKLRLLKEKTTNELLNNIIHHWTQPITALGLQIFSLDSVFKTQNKQKFDEITNDMEKTIKNLSDNLNIFQKIYNYKDDSVVSINEILKNLQIIVTPSLNIHNIKLDINLEEIEKFNSLYKDFLDILLVLVDNSKEAIIKTKPNEPFININIHIDKEYMKINIIDNGGGISDDIKGKIFDVYYSNKYEKNFTGMGLFFAKSVIEKRYNGKIQLLPSTHQNQTNFLITIPNS